MKKEPEFNIDKSNLESEQIEINSDFSNVFADRLVNWFKDGACHYLEAKRLVETNDVKNEIELIANDERVKLQRKQAYFAKGIFK